MNTGLLCILWISWCAMHSILIDVSVMAFITRRWPGMASVYRLLYNGLSFLTLVPLVVVSRMSAGEVVFSWDGYVTLLRIVLIVAALLLFSGGARRYDFKHFIGMKQLQTGENHLLMNDRQDFAEAGVFGMVRHPWYLGSLLFIWSILPAYPLPLFLVATILSGYLVIGTLLEERKIITQYGDSYRSYQQRVSMLFPWKWLKRKLKLRGM